MGLTTQQLLSPGPVNPKALDNVVVRIFNHNNFYQGICLNPAQYNCGAPEEFRFDYCAKGEPRCFLVNLFGKEFFQYKTFPNFFDFNIENLIAKLVFFWSFGTDRRARMSGIYRVADAGPVSKFNPMEYRTLNALMGDQDLSSLIIPNFVEYNDQLTTLTTISVASYYSSPYEDRFRRISNENALTMLKKIRRATELGIMEGRTHSFSNEKVNEMFTRMDANIASYEEGIRLWQAQQELAAKTQSAAIQQAAAPTMAGGSQITLHKASPKPIQKNGTIIRLVKRPFTALTQELDKVVSGINSQGFYFDPELIRSYHLSLQACPFVVIAGIPGCGKTRLCLRYAEAVAGEYAIFSVRPDWTTDESLLGHVGFNEQFQPRFFPSRFSQFLNQAKLENDKATLQNRPPKRYFACLDELALTRPENYLSEILAKIDLDDNDRAIFLHNLEKDPFPAQIVWPPNFYIVGLLNTDESAFSLSSKLLDRVNLIVLDQINLEKLAENLKAQGHPAYEVDETFYPLIRINTILAQFNKRFGYRVAQEIFDWVIQAVENRIFQNYSDALDVQLVQKVLNKLEFSPDAHDAIAAVVAFLESSEVTEESAEGEQQPKYPRSLALVKRILSKLKGGY